LNEGLKIVLERPCRKCATCSILAQLGGWRAAALSPAPPALVTPTFTRPALLLLALLELLLNVASELPDGVGPALPAVPHLLHDLGELVLDLLLLGRRRGGEVREPILGDQRHHVLDVDPKLLDGLCDLHHVIVVYGGDEDGVHLDDHLPLRRFLKAPKLMVEEDLGGLKPRVLLPLVGDVLVDLLSDIRVDCVQGDGDVADAEAVKPVDLIGQKETVGADA